MGRETGLEREAPVHLFAMHAERWLAEGPVDPELAGGGWGTASEQVASVIS